MLTIQAMTLGCHGRQLISSSLSGLCNALFLKAIEGQVHANHGRYGQNTYILVTKHAQTLENARKL